MKIYSEKEVRQMKFIYNMALGVAIAGFVIMTIISQNCFV